MSIQGKIISSYLIIIISEDPCLDEYRCVFNSAHTPGSSLVSITRLIINETHNEIFSTSDRHPNYDYTRNTSYVHQYFNYRVFTGDVSQSISYLILDYDTYAI